MTVMKSRRVLVLVALAAATFSTAAMAERGYDRGDGAMMLQRFDEVDANKDGMLTEAEVQAFRAGRFAAADVDGNGSLSAEEMSALQMQQMQDRMAQRTKKMMQRLDANGDGQLSAEELAKMGDGRGGKSKSDKGKPMFQRADTDGDGMLSKAEAEAALKRMADRDSKKGWGSSDD